MLVARKVQNLRAHNANWQLRCHRFAPLDRWLCVPTFRLVCHFFSQSSSNISSIASNADKASKLKMKRNLSQFRDVSDTRSLL